MTSERCLRYGYYHNCNTLNKSIFSSLSRGDAESGAQSPYFPVLVPGLALGIWLWHWHGESTHPDRSSWLSGGTASPAGGGGKTSGVSSRGVR